MTTLSESRLRGIKRGLEGLDRMLPMAATMDGRLPLHQDCRELAAEVERVWAVLQTIADAQPERLDFWDLKELATHALFHTGDDARH